MFSSRVPALLSLSLGIAAAYAPTDTSDTNPTRDWEAYKSKYKKSYRDQDDEAARHALFITAQARVAELNALNGKAGSAFGITWTSDRYPQETHKKGLRKPKDFVPSAPVREYSAPRRNPKSVNWRYTEAVTAIKNQGQCGSCWAFSAAEAVESQMILGSGGKLAIDLSPQQIASCAPQQLLSRGYNPMFQRLQPYTVGLRPYAPQASCTPSTGAHGCLGCEGGFTEGAYDYLRSVAGLANAFYIPYRQSLTETSTTKACPTLTLTPTPIPILPPLPLTRLAPPHWSRRSTALTSSSQAATRQSNHDPNPNPNPDPNANPSPNPNPNPNPNLDQAATRRSAATSTPRRRAQQAAASPRTSRSSRPRSRRRPSRSASTRALGTTTPAASLAAPPALRTQTCRNTAGL